MRVYCVAHGINVILSLQRIGRWPCMSALRFPATILCFDEIFCT
jgi:hypothetical protein